MTELHRIDFSALRATVHAAVKRRKQHELERRQSPKSACEHDWHTFRQSIPQYRDNYATDPPYLGADAYFIVKACLRCHEKRNIDYVVVW